MQPEMSRNVQKYSKEVYLRASEAQQCRVHSAVVLPLFTAGDRGTSLGIIEVVQTRQDMSFADIVTHLAQALEVRPRRPLSLAIPESTLQDHSNRADPATDVPCGHGHPSGSSPGADMPRIMLCRQGRV